MQTTREETKPGQPAEPALSPAAQDHTPLAEAFWYCLKVFLGVRIGLALLAVLATALLEPLPASGLPGWPAPDPAAGWGNLFTAWERWDAIWFLRIATGGYVEGDGSAAFFPLYPLLIRGLSFVIGGHPLAAALLISNACFLGALVFVYRLTMIEFDDVTTARRSVVYLAIFPTAFFFLAPYSESLFLLAVAGSLLAARTGRWPLAGICGALAAATRSVGVILVVPLAIEAWLQTSDDQEGRLRKLAGPLAWSLSVTVGTLSYLGYWQLRTGDAGTPLDAQNGWLREFALPWESLVEGSRQAFRFVGQYPGGYHEVDWLLLFVAMIAAVWVALHVRASYVAYVALSVSIPLMLVFGGRPFMSLPRFLLPVFPLFWAMAALARRYRAHTLIVAASAAGLGVLTLLFVNWYFIF